jgi:hypothetical protein
VGRAELELKTDSSRSQIILADQKDDLKPNVAIHAWPDHSIIA